MTNSAMGAMQPAASPDGRQVAYVSYSRAGFDLARLDFPGGPLPEAPPAAARPGAIPYDRSPGYPAVPYDPLPMLLPRYWLPVFGWDAAGFTLGALSSASDVVGLHSWAAELRWCFGTASPVYDVAYVGQWLRTPLLLGSTRWIGSAPDLSGVYEEVWTPLRASVLVPIRELYRHLSLSLGWSGTFYRALNPPPEPLPLQDGFRSMISGSLAYDDTRRFVNSISRISGFQASVAGGVTSPVLGSDYDYVWGEVAWNGYLRVPGTKQWVLALHLAGGTSAGTFGGQYPFSLGGVPQPDVTALLLSALGFATAGSQPNQLRGYPSGVFQGSKLLSGTFELRFPIAAPQWGYSTWPFFLRRISGRVFLDAGNAWVPMDGDPLVAAHPLRHRRRGRRGARPGLLPAGRAARRRRAGARPAARSRELPGPVRRDAGLRDAGRVVLAHSRRLRGPESGARNPAFPCLRRHSSAGRATDS